MTKLSAFLNDEVGAVTVDFVVLTAAVAVLGLMIITVVSPKVQALANTIAGQLDEATAVLANDGS